MNKKEEVIENIEIIEHYKELSEQCDIILDKLKKKNKKRKNVKQK